MADPPLPAAAAAADGDPPTVFVPEAANNAVADMGHPQVDHGGGVAIAGGIFKPCLVQDQAVEDLLHQLP